jgi:hypothetical protein
MLSRATSSSFESRPRYVVEPPVVVPATRFRASQLSCGNLNHLLRRPGKAINTHALRRVHH